MNLPLDWLPWIIAGTLLALCLVGLWLDWRAAKNRPPSGDGGTF